MKNVLVMYHGERTNWMGKIWQLFKDKKGREYNFTGIRFVYFGQVYRITDNKMSRRPDAVAVKGWEPTEEERLKYEAQKLVVLNQRQSNLKAMKIRRPHDDLVTAAHLIRPFFKHLSLVEQRRFIEWFSNECSKPSTKSKRRRK